MKVEDSDEYCFDTYHVGKKSSGLELSKEGITSSFQKTYLDISLPAFLQCSSIISEMFFLGELQLIFNRMTFTERVRCFPNDLGSQKLKQLPGIGYFNYLNVSTTALAAITVTFNKWIQ